MAHDLGVVKSEAKKNRGLWTPSDLRSAGAGGCDDSETFRFLRGLVSHVRRSRFGRVDRAAADGHADEQDSHGSTGEEGELGIMSPAERSGDAQPNERKDEPDLAPVRPGRPR